MARVTRPWLQQAHSRREPGTLNSYQAMELLTLIETRRRSAQNGAVEARVHVQVEGAAGRVTRDQKPYCELILADAADRMTLRVWSDSPDYATCESLKVSDFIELTGEFQQHQQFGLEARKWKIRSLTDQERSEFVARAGGIARKAVGRLGVHR